MKTIQFHKLFFYILLLAVVLCSCEDIVEVDINDEDIDLISVEAYINTTSKHNIFVKLEKSLPIDESESNPPINNAVVEISDDEPVSNTIILEEYEQSGMYFIPEYSYYEAVPGRTYKLKITTSDGIIITGEEYLQKVETLDTVRINLSPLGDYEYLGIYINSQETPGSGHYYKWDIYINNHLLYDAENLTFASDEFVDGNYIYDLELFVDWYDEEEENEDGEVESDRILLLGDTVVVAQMSITSAVYDFYMGMVNQAWAGSPFSVPPANIANNLSSSDNKRVLGIFSARDVSVGNMVIIDSTNFTPMVPSVDY